MSYNYFVPRPPRNFRGRRILRRNPLVPQNQLAFFRPKNRFFPRRTIPNFNANNLVKRKNNRPRPRFLRNNMNRPMNIANPNFINPTFKTKNNNIVSSKLKVPNTCYYDESSFVIPIHPIFLNQRLLNQAINFTQYRIINLIVHTVPLVPTTDATSLVLGYTTHCTPITQDNTLMYDEIANLGGATGMAHTAIHYKIPNVETLWHPIVPVVPSDVPYIIFISSQDPVNIDLTEKISVYLTLTIQFQTNYSGNEIDNVLPIDTLSFSNTIAGTLASAVCPTTFGFVIASTCPNVDLGELLVSPSYPDILAHTTYPKHNSTPMDPVITVKDRGTIRPISKVIN